MAQDSTAPATKQDVALIMEGIGGVHIALATMKTEMSDLREELTETMDEKISAVEDRMVHQFYVIAEQIHHDAIGANRDEIEVVKDRVTRLERHTGLLKA